MRPIQVPWMDFRREQPLHLRGLQRASHTTFSLLITLLALGKLRPQGRLGPLVRYHQNAGVSRQALVFKEEHLSLPPPPPPPMSDTEYPFNLVFSLNLGEESHSGVHGILCMLGIAPFLQ